MKRLVFLLVCSLVLCGNTNAWKKETGKVKTVVIDPGHGGDKPGAIGKHCTEKDIVLQVARKLGQLIGDNYPDVKVIYTRTSDVDIALSERARIANTSKADLFLSIHANSHPTAAPSGVESFVMGLSKSKANMDVARKENADILLESDYKTNSAYQGFDPDSPESSIIFAMFQNAYLDKSLTFAELIQKQYGQHLHTVNRGVKQAEFIVLYMSAMPAVLTEIGFISNPAEEAFMMSESGQAKIAVALFNAFMAYKCAEEGIQPLSKPVINLPGYGKNAPTPQKDPPPSSPVERPVAAEQPQPHSPEVPPSADTLQPQPPASAETVSAEQPPAEKPVYKVQFLSLNRHLKDGARELRGVTDFEIYEENGTLRYLKGRETTINKAKAIQRELRETGFKDAFIVAFYKGRKISIQQARALTE
ncbi:MAG: N-acetylmuramoyl-L-alanine amidase [bacterium P3]|nr:MAG: N-acetylmuramoyl-L-alanine amidase [bacterium P3]KWW40998.1 MAG: N-acetylmuramoyl-L-alanine amidase [bacterium F083]